MCFRSLQTFSNNLEQKDKYFVTVAKMIFVQLYQLFGPLWTAPKVSEVNITWGWPNLNSTAPTAFIWAEALSYLKKN